MKKIFLALFVFASYITYGQVGMQVTPPNSIKGYVNAFGKYVSFNVDSLNISLFGTSVAGLVPASGGGTTNFLRADGTFAAPPGGGGGGGDALTTNGLNQFAATTSANFFGVITNETGSGSVVGSVSPAFTSIPTAPTAAANNNSTQLATTAYVDTKQFANIGIYQALGSQIKAEPLIRITDLTQPIALATGAFRLVAVWLPTAATITGVQFFQRTSGVYTASDYNGVGLYTYSAGTLTLVASSTNDGNIWKATATTWSSKAFSSTYSAAAGLYFIGCLYNTSAQTTAPTIGGTDQFTSAAISTVDFTNSAKISGAITSTLSLPSSQAMSGVATSTLQVYFALY